MTATQACEGSAGGYRLGRYQLLSRVGFAGTGEVHLARDDDRWVAVKVLWADLPVEIGRLRLAHEVRALRRAQGPGVIELLDADLDGPDPSW